ncbi:MAG: double-strand break repair helicase AddA [Alphaproteobacteria bacterium]
MTVDMITAAGIAQRRAVHPEASVWVAASAGSGKTKVLTDRVLALLLNETRPERILCLTFTRAAAAEMAVRINRRLAGWATEPDDAVRRDIGQLLGAAPDDDRLDRARRLFAQVLDVPGGLKVQTIHGFCQSLLARFPLEAGIAPHFEAMDDRSAAELMLAARDMVLTAARQGGELADALAVVTGHIQEEQFAALMDHMAQNRSRIRGLIDLYGDGMGDAVCRKLGVAPGQSPADVISRACWDAAVDTAALTRAGEALLTGTAKTDQPRGLTLLQWLKANPVKRQELFAGYADAFLTKAGDLRSRLITVRPADAAPGSAEALGAEAERLAGVMDECRAVVTAEATVALLRLGAALLDAYERSKLVLARLDYDDLILKTIALLNRSADAAWVLYKLDGGLDHILIDEAQDTNLHQWAIVEALAKEFFSGAGARTETRTVFTVGDAKQSIFSFQGADPTAFTHMREVFRKQVEAAAKPWESVDLNWSFRSATPILDTVDAVFGIDPARDGVAPDGEPIVHRAVRAGHAGLVEIWPPVRPRDAPDAAPWAPPLDREAADNPSARLANVLAAKIESWIGCEVLASRGRTVRAGDIMVLVRRRNRFVDQFVRALKSRGIPVAGVDRMALAEQLAVMDLIALGEFLLLPEDNLTLATVLKGPFIGLDDDNLFALAYDRGDSSLWQRLAADPRYAAAHGWLSALLARVDFAPPFELFSHVLTAPVADGESGRQRLVARLGVEAEDPVEEFMNLTLEHERLNPPSLQGFLHWLKAGDQIVKRDMEHGSRDEVRVITVHGAKGLQAPIVILPDTMAAPRSSPDMLWSEGILLWPPNRGCESAVSATARAAANLRRDQEYRRLLYVAMTRAEDRLYICGAEGRQAPPDTCWYAMAHAGLEAIGEPFAFSADGEDGWEGEGIRLSSLQSVDSAPDAATIADDEPPAEALPWMFAPAPPEPTPVRPLTPSRPAMDPPVVSPFDTDNGQRFRRGTLIHRLLQTLPDLSPARRRAAAGGFLALQVHGLTPEEQDVIVAEVMAVLENPEFAALFGPDSRAEAPVVGRIDSREGPEIVSGQVDRVVIRDDEILVVDYKTNRPPPRREADVAEVYLRQMAAYRAILRQIWPDRPVRCALLWTDGPRIMALNDSLLDRFFDAP